MHRCDPASTMSSVDSLKRSASMSFPSALISTGWCRFVGRSRIDWRYNRRRRRDERPGPDFAQASVREPAAGDVRRYQDTHADESHWAEGRQSRLTEESDELTLSPADE